MKVSIITVSYNSERTIRDTFNSVLNQTYPNIEYIVVDGNSTDGTIDVIKEYISLFGERMRWISEPDKGLYDAMNKGIMMSSGDVIMLINSDDIFVNRNVITQIADVFKQNKSIDAVYADIDYIDRTNPQKVVRSWVTGNQRKFSKGWHPAHPTFYVKKMCYEKYGYFDLRYKYSADFELMLRFVEKCHIQLVYLPVKMVRMRIGGLGNRTLSNRIKANLECIKAFTDNNIRISPFYLIYRWWPKILGIIKK
jgi:glycosyltransferase involved in cell wall biosynthesis